MPSNIYSSPPSDYAMTHVAPYWCDGKFQVLWVLFGMHVELPRNAPHVFVTSTMPHTLECGSPWGFVTHSTCVSHASNYLYACFWPWLFAGSLAHV